MHYSITFNGINLHDLIKINNQNLKDQNNFVKYTSQRDNSKELFIMRKLRK